MSNSVQNTGHADIVEGLDGQWWGVALGVRPQNGNFSHIQLGRETFLFPVTWEENWPVFNHGRPIEEVIDVLFDHSPTARYIDNFTSHTLDPSFYFLRAPYKPFHSLTAKPGFLRLDGNPYAVGDRDSPALLLRKQTSYTETFESELQFRPTSNLTEAGLTVFYGDLLHNEIGIIGDSSARWIILRTATQTQQVGPWALVTTNASTTTTSFVQLRTVDVPVKLKIMANPTSYSLGFAEGSNATFQFPVTFDASSVSLPTAGGFFFKGVSFGVYNTGNGRPTLAPADFAYWDQTPSPPQINGNETTSHDPSPL
ncbi:hypothetical protein ONZ45_g12321 [Pleurotus djamor]|nr:hypothetical protein ONZ45_g12321 [Pleurotus djamor]